MTDKKSPRYIGITSDVAFKLNLDPDIYNAQLATVLGVGNALIGEQKVITCDLKTAVRDGHAKLLKVKVVRNKDQPNEVKRTIELICDIEKTDTAPDELIGKTVKIGNGNSPPSWEIVK